MSNTDGGQSPPQGGEDAPYAPTTHGLGGTPEIIPDVPITTVFLFFYVVMAIIHFRIMKAGQNRGHKFVFSGALFGFCKIRIITMTMRIVWAVYNRNVSVGIAAQVFVYVGTIILFIANHFFTQRVVRAQHPRWGWSKPYRIFHIVSLICLILTLLMIVVSSIQQYFTLDPETQRIDEDLHLTGQTYFAAFCFAPIPIVLLSLALPRRGTEKFGAGRLRNNIAILLAASTILSIGAIFRCVTGWLPQRPLLNAQGQLTEEPWYFSKACFYIFNFTTEILVVIFYAVTRVDLRFHIPNGAKGPGAYRAGRDPRYHVEVVGNEKNLKRQSRATMEGMIHPNVSSDTLQEYQTSLFDDSKTLADSLRYPSSVLEVDKKTGHWKLKRASGATLIPGHYSDTPEPSIWSPDRDTYLGDDIPPVPDWPLRESQLPRGSIPVMEHQNRHRNWSATTSTSDLKRSHDVGGYDTNSPDTSNAITDAIAKLEANSELNKKRIPDFPPDYDAITPIKPRSGFYDFPIEKKHQPGADLRPKQTYRPSKLAISSTSSDLPQKESYAPSPTSDGPHHAITAFTPPPRSQSSLQSLRQETTRSPASTGHDMAEEEFARFSYEAPPRPGDTGFDGNTSDGDMSYDSRRRRR